MFHPLEQDLSTLKDSEVEDKLRELTRKYYQAQRLGNPALLTQLSTFVTIYRNELSQRQLRSMNSNLPNDELGQLINVN